MKMSNGEIVCAVIGGRDNAEVAERMRAFDEWFRREVVFARGDAQ